MRIQIHNIHWTKTLNKDYHLQMSDNIYFLCVQCCASVFTYRRFRIWQLIQEFSGIHHSLIEAQVFTIWCHETGAGTVTVSTWGTQHRVHSFIVYYYFINTYWSKDIYYIFGIFVTKLDNSHNLNYAPLLTQNSQQLVLGIKFHPQATWRLNPCWILIGK